MITYIANQKWQTASLVTGQYTPCNAEAKLGRNIEVLGNAGEK